MTPAPTRRAVLLAAAAVAAAGCTDGARPVAPAPPDPDVALADEAARRERRLLAAYDEAVARDPSLAARLGPLRAEHAAHLAALGAPTAAPAADPAAQTAPPAPEPVAAAPALPADPAAVVPALAELERRASAAHAGAAVRAGRGTAVVLASLAASEAAHAAVLA